VPATTPGHPSAVLGQGAEGREAGEDAKMGQERRACFGVREEARGGAGTGTRGHPSHHAGARGGAPEPLGFKQSGAEVPLWFAFG
jgi:hypothetical protein